jgi:hypothetical protein
VADGGAHAVGAGVATADDDDIFAFGGDEVAVGALVENCFGVGTQEVHCEVDAF